MAKPKICQHCACYKPNLHYCPYLKRHVGNINTCSEWRPKMELAMNKDVIFSDYNQYSLNM